MFAIAWTHRLPARPLGLSLAGEAGGVLTWDAAGGLTRLDAHGQVAWQRHPAEPAVLLAGAADGRSFVWADATGQVRMATADGATLWARAAPGPAALAIDAWGHRVAVAQQTELSVLDSQGKTCWHTVPPRPLRHLAFVVESALLLAAAEFALVCAYDPAGTCLWRDGLMTHIGALAVTGEERLAYLACFTRGLCGYQPRHGRQTALPSTAPTRLVSVCYRGDHFATVDLDAGVRLWTDLGTLVGEHRFSAPVIALALSPLADYLVAALASGEVIRLDLMDPPMSRS